MRIDASLPPRALPVAASRPTAESVDSPGDGFTASSVFTSDNLKFAGVAAACGAVGFGGAMARSIPVVGPAISGLVGAAAGASAGAAAASVLPGQHIRAGALLGLVGGAILGASGSGPAVTTAMTVAAATAPYGLLLAVFSGAE